MCPRTPRGKVFRGHELTLNPLRGAGDPKLLLVSAVNDLPLGSSRVQPKAPHDMEICPGARFVGSEWGSICLRPWHPHLPREGKASKNDGGLTEMRIGHATRAADRRFQATTAHPALLINSFKSMTWFGKHSSDTVMFSRRMTDRCRVLLKVFDCTVRVPRRGCWNSGDGGLLSHLTPTRTASLHW